MQRLLLVALGGALGSVARHLLGNAIGARVGAGFPWGTLAVNTIGCFAIGVLLQAGLAHERFTLAKLLLVTGVLGGFTTYSSFNQEAIELARAGELARAAAYVGTTLLTCLVAGVAGGALGRVAATR